MAYESFQIKIPGLEANADLSAKQYYLVKMVAGTKVDVCAATTDKPIGILQNKPTATQTAEVCAVGVTKVSSAAALNLGDSIGTAVDGRAAVYTATDTTKHIVGQVLIASGAAGELATALVNCATNRHTLA